ncbi:MAG: CDP-diacylglycerol--glycerol-3-phosphate 3-phosphatidyltransferase [Rhodobacter sp.]|jgi:CDP-diacylglycerol--glycerol-3-phosphate 3-phosphatidyltransferase|nr:CDP-diacylglycerol--glycerol-3-phosphate 3-phosphatidyltransferase [Rhodobacter sp.]
MTWTIPNILTVLRLLAAPGVAIMFLYFARPWADWFALLLFIAAAITDYIDGYLARAWKQETVFGAMLDPIADKAMVVIALLVITGFSGMNPWILLPAVVILFREIFVSGLREYLGARMGKLKVTQIAKYKTFAQMVALTVLFATGIFEHNYIERTVGMDETIVQQILSGELADTVGLNFNVAGAYYSWWGGVVLLWVAAALTLLSGLDYFRKSLPYLRDKDYGG